MFIQDSSTLKKLCEEFRGKTPLGFDTEFVREKSYYPRLEVFQIVAEDKIAVIDCQQIDDLEPLWDLIMDPETEKVVHSGGQDMELTLQESGRLPPSIFDTQIAAALLGLGSQCGYGRLVSQILGKKTPKGETFSDWSQRPLHPKQIKYAAKDVEFLLELKSVLERRLKKRNRLHWLAEECSHLCDPETFRKAEPHERFLRIKGRRGLDPESLSVLRALADWRDRVSESRDVQPLRVVRDHVLLAIAKACPKTVEELKRLRGLHGGELGRYGKELVETVKQGLEEAATNPVKSSEPKKTFLDQEPDGVFKILSAVLQIRADEAKISSSMVATSQDIHDLISGYRNDRLDDHPLLTTWRRELAGEALLSVLQGKLSLRIHPEEFSLVMEKVDE